MKLLSIPVPVVCLLLAGLLLATSPAAGAEVDGPTRKSVRTAREHLEAGRFPESLEIYESILSAEAELSGPEASGRKGKVRSEALFRSSLLLLIADETPRNTNLARQRLGEARAPGVEAERGLATKALLLLLTELDELRLELESEQAARSELDARMESATEDLGHRRSASEAEAEASRREMQETSSRLVAASRDLAGCRVERDLLTDQLGTTQVDQTQMLESVFRKNDELAAQAAELSRIRTELEERSETLAQKEEELEEREEAIRRVTEAILDEGESGDDG